MTQTKHHYSKVFKSNHLGCADLEDFLEQGKSLHFTIKHVRQEINVDVAGRRGNYNIAYFVEPIKPLVLNSTNSKMVKNLAGNSPFVEDWNDVAVELYIDSSVKMKGDVVGGVRLKGGIKQPAKDKPILDISSDHWAVTEKWVASNLYKGAPKLIELLSTKSALTDAAKNKITELCNQ